MHIGDKVRLLHENEEGIIVGFPSAKLVEVEIVGGFSIPVPRNEVVPVARMEDEVFISKKRQDSYKARNVFSNRGIYLAFVERDRQFFELYLINNTDFQLSYTAWKAKGTELKGIKAGHLAPRSEAHLERAFLPEMEFWRHYLIKALRFNAEASRIPLTLEGSFQYHPKKFFDSKQLAPLLDRQALLFQLDLEKTEKVNKAQAKVIQEEMVESKQTLEPVVVAKAPAVRPELEIDLHAETLGITDLHDKELIMAEQLKVFRKELDDALVNQAAKITFIHGVGNGTLKYEIQKELSGNPHVKYYKEGRKEKFGYGATDAIFN